LFLSNLTVFWARSDPLQYIQASATQFLPISCLCEKGRCVSCLRVSGKNTWGVEAIYIARSRIHTYCSKCMVKELVWQAKVKVKVKYNREQTSALDGAGGQRHAPAALPPGKTADTHCTGRSVGPTADLDRCRKSRPHRNSIPGPSSTWRVAILTELSKAHINLIVPSLFNCANINI